MLNNKNMENRFSALSVHLLCLILGSSTVYSEAVTTDTPVEHLASDINLPDTAGNTTGEDNATIHNVTHIPPAISNSTVALPETAVVDLTYLAICPDNAPCENLGANCITCKLNYYCVYGKIQPVDCTVRQNVSCIGNRDFKRPYHCSYGYQLSKEHVSCDIVAMTSKCSMKKSPPESYVALCRVKDDVLCLGNRTFNKRFPCNWTSGYKWSTALVLSVTLGGFGVDRFYLGLWRQGMGKLFSFGGLGVWTIVDVILIAVGYVGPHDGSLYIYPWD